MPPWTLWRLKPPPKKPLAVIELPFSYLFQPDPPKRFLSLNELSEVQRRLKLDTSPTLVGNLYERPLGAMRTLQFSITKHPRVRGAIVPRNAPREVRYELWLTPPVTQFADLKKVLPADVLRYGSPSRDIEGKNVYYIQPEVYEAAGEIISGGLHRSEPRVIKVVDIHKVTELMQEEGETNEVGGTILAALDSFLARHHADPRFNPGGAGALLPSSSTADRIRAAVRARTDRCDDQCPGWGVFEVDRAPGVEIEACDECNQLAAEYGHPTFTDAEFEELPEAQAALAAAQAAE